ncbi:MAG TPA: OmpA family protein [Panacibacter sp.]|nr:OmpA family protein [Panacibacter sp.]
MIKIYKKIIPVFIIAFLFSCKCLFAQRGIAETIYFKTNSYIISRNYKNILNEVAAKCTSDTFRSLKIIAYTDTAGLDDFNNNLSKKRAYEVYNYLNSHAKLDTSKVYIEWLGKSGEEVVYDLHVPVAHIQKRCVDIWVDFKKK